MRLRKFHIFIVCLIFLVGCATPVTVKQAIKQQSEAYTELQAALREFNQLYGDLNDHLLRMNQKSRTRIEGLAMVYKLSGQDLSQRTKDLNPYAHKKEENVNEIATQLDNSDPSRAETLKAINKSVKLLEEAFKHGAAESKRPDGYKQIQKTLEDVNNAHKDVMSEIRALMVMHDAVGEYLQIDLTPEAKALKEAITNIKTIRK